MSMTANNPPHPLKSVEPTYSERTQSAMAYLTRRYSSFKQSQVRGIFKNTIDKDALRSQIVDNACSCVVLHRQCKDVSNTYVSVDISEPQFNRC